MKRAEVREGGQRIAREESGRPGGDRSAKGEKRRERRKTEENR